MLYIYLINGTDSKMIKYEIYCDITVVIPTYNSEKFVNETIMSVVNQSLKPKEIIIIDDHSTDNTLDVIEDIFRKQGIINYRIFKQKKLGPGAARNKGIKEAKTKWISFLDSDDYWCQNKLEEVNGWITKNPESNFFCNNEIEIGLNKQEKLNDYVSDFDFQKSFTVQVFQKNYFSTSAITCSRKLLMEYGCFNETLSSAQDYELWLRISPALNPIFIGQPLGYYVMRRGNISTTQYWKRLRNILLVKWIHRGKVRKTIFILNIVKVIFHHLFLPFLTFLKIRSH